MENFIEIHDNILPLNIQDDIENLTLQNLPWYYLPNIATTDPLVKDPGFTHSFINTLTPDESYTNSNFQSNFNNILYFFAQKQKIWITNIIRGRLFLHLPTHTSTSDSVHIDYDFPHWVCLYYVTDTDGDTVLFEQDMKTEIKRVTPKKGRIVFFNGLIPHCSSKPTKSTRAIINFDFQGYKFGKEKEN